MELINANSYTIYITDKDGTIHTGTPSYEPLGQFDRIVKFYSDNEFNNLVIIPLENVKTICIVNKK